MKKEHHRARVKDKGKRQQARTITWARPWGLMWPATEDDAKGRTPSRRSLDTAQLRTHGIDIQLLSKSEPNRNGKFETRIPPETGPSKVGLPCGRQPSAHTRLYRTATRIIIDGVGSGSSKTTIKSPVLYYCRKHVSNLRNKYDRVAYGCEREEEEAMQGRRDLALQKPKKPYAAA
ncbi:hypothetical protein LZ31DRAFT_550997 [Colletotrichum somersetense]|nr:hypothetical protein LZ31DRAFT_550997 [Colletotrichum somersetense]